MLPAEGIHVLGGGGSVATGSATLAQTLTSSETGWILHTQQLPASSVALLSTWYGGCVRGP